MWFESFWNYENPWNNEQKETQRYDLGLLVGTQNQIESEARNYVLREEKNGRDIWEVTYELNNLVERQRTENESVEKLVQSETRETLDKEACIQEAKTQIYEKCGISDNMWDNSAFENFSKWFIDTMVLDNYDMAMEVINTKWQVIIDALKQLASWEWLKQMAQALWESVWDLFTWNAYERGKAIADLWLVATWVWITATLWKKAIKLWMKEISKLKVNKEILVNAPEVKEVVSSTNRKVEEIIPKQEFDFWNTLADNLPESQLKQLQRLKQRLQDREFISDRLPLREFKKLDLNWQLDILWIPNEYYDLLNNSGLLPEWFNLIDRYKKLQYRDEMFNGTEVINYQSMINESISKYPNLTLTEALLIFASTDKFLFQSLNSKLRKQQPLTSPEQAIIDTFNNGLDKLPNLDGQTLRWDKWAWWIVDNPDSFDWIQNLEILNNIDVKKLKKWDNIPLHAPTYVSNNINDIFIIPEHSKSNTLVIIKWMEWQVKDISSLAMFPNFAEKLGYREMWYEWVMKPNSLVEVDSIQQKKKELPDRKWWKFLATVIEVQVKQVK